MILTQVPSLRVEDFPEQKEWIGNLFNQFNPFIQSVNQIFTNNIDFSTNIKSVTRSYSITTFQEFSFQWPYAEKPVDLRVVSATTGTQKTPTVLLVAWAYDSTQTKITVSKIFEISASGVTLISSGNYSFTIRVSV